MDDSKLYVIFNQEPVLEFDRRKPVPGHQRQYLDQMDVRMDKGIQLGDGFVKTPNALQRSQFVANSLVNALIRQDFNQAIAMCTYLAKRMPDLKQIKCETKGGESVDKENADMSIEFVYDRSYEQASQEQTIQFFKPDNNTSH